MKGGPTVHLRSRDTVVLDDDLRAGRAGLGRHRQDRPRGQRPARLLQGPGEDGARRSSRCDGTRYVDARRLRDGRGRRHDHAARPRLGVHQLGRREDLPRRGRGRAQGRIPTCSTRVVVGVPDERWGERVAAVVQPRAGPRADARRRSHAHCRNELAGYKVPRELHLVERHRALAERQARLPLGEGGRHERTVATQCRTPPIGAPHANRTLRHVRDRVPDLRVHPLPRRRRRGEQGRAASACSARSASGPSSSRSSSTGSTSTSTASRTASTP